MPDGQTGSIDSREDFKQTPRGQYNYWCEEVEAAEKRLRKWHKEATLINHRFLDNRRGMSEDNLVVDNASRLNLFHANTKTLMSIIYGNLPKVDVSRRYADPDDDISRVSGEIMERLLNLDIQQDGEKYNQVLKSCLQDRLIPGMGIARVRYEMQKSTRTVAAVLDQFGQVIQEEREEEYVSFEDAPVDYFHWRDVLWGWGRNFKELPWISFKIFMTKDEVRERWGDKIAESLQYTSQKPNENSTNNDEWEDPETASVWNKAEVLEIWDKTSREVVWFSKGYDRIIETKEDFLKLENFFPCPPFLIANATTALYLPTPDWHLVKDLYQEIDRLQTRISMITEAVKVVGVYDSDAGESVGRIMKEGRENDLIPVPQWSKFAEKGGLAGSIEWMPLIDIVGALDKLIEVRDQTIALLQRITGITDVLRGESSQYAGASQVKQDARNASIPIQALQQEFSSFATGLMALKAEVISKHYDVETIISQSNIANTKDANLAVDAANLIKMYRVARLKVDVRPESLAMIDYAELKQERGEYMMSMAQFWQSSGVILKEDPEMKPFFLEIFQWAMAGLKGSSEIEGVLDRAIAAAQEKILQMKQNPPKDPNAQNAQMQMQIENMKQKGELAKIQAKAQADLQLRQADQQADIQTTFAELQADIKQIEAQMNASMAEVKANLQADVTREIIETQSNIAQSKAAAETEVQKDAAQAQMEIEKEGAKSMLKINEIAASTEGKILESSEKETNTKQDD